jgi:hypothetical protein
LRLANCVSEKFGLVNVDSVIEIPDVDVNTVVSSIFSDRAGVWMFYLDYLKANLFKDFSLARNGAQQLK